MNLRQTTDNKPSGLINELNQNINSPFRMEKVSFIGQKQKTLRMLPFVTRWLAVVGEKYGDYLAGEVDFCCEKGGEFFISRPYCGNLPEKGQILLRIPG
jgi:hypothetical protein